MKKLTALIIGVAGFAIGTAFADEPVIVNPVIVEPTTITTTTTVVSATHTLQEAASKVHGQADIGFNSEYINRGKKQAQASVNPAAQFNAPVGNGTAYVGTWINFPGDQQNVNNEVRFNAGYELPLTALIDSKDVLNVEFTLDAGYTYYWYLNNHLGASGMYQPLSRANEAYVGLMAKMIANPAAYAFYDFDREQLVVQVSLRHSFDLGQFMGATGFSFDVGASAGWLKANAYNGNQRPVDVDKWHNSYAYAQGDVELVYALNEVAKIGLGFHIAGNKDGKGIYTDNTETLWANVGDHQGFMWWSINGSYQF